MNSTEFSTCCNNTLSRPGIRLYAKRLPALFLAVLLFGAAAMGQDTITFKKPVRKSPRKATLYSMALPGLGQAYNGKYWKIPVIYAGFATVGYFGALNGGEYSKFRAAYEYKINGETGDPPNDYANRYTAEQLRTQRDYYRRNMEFNYILAGFLYILNMVDAAVDAHLSDFDISDDLSLKLTPLPPPADKKMPFHNQAGMGLTLSWAIKSR